VDLYPAIDLRGGRCVRLVGGDFSAETVYGEDPVAVARAFQAAGARWIHVVDLDAARTGAPVNRPVVVRIAEAVPGVRVQAGGGVRTPEDAADLLAAGVARVVVGTAAVERPELVAEIAGHWPGQVAVGLDHRAGVAQVRGWTQGGRGMDELIPEVVAVGAAALIVTDIQRDGRLSGPDLCGLSVLLGQTTAPIIASGGVRTIDDIRALARLRGPRADAAASSSVPTDACASAAAPSAASSAAASSAAPVSASVSQAFSPASPKPARLAGVIAGTAIYKGQLDLAEALSECASRDPAE
jgi:phosphoribosylformimino-5-aminoimidazole carboxamide ribotide isomerase